MYEYSLSGTKTIGPGGDYVTLTAAIQAIQTNGLSRPLTLEIMSDYVSAGETFPITFTNLSTTSTNTLSVRPANNASNLLISGLNSTAIIRIQNEDYVIIDGRPEGAGTNRELTIRNTNTSGAAIRFDNNASFNTISYCKIEGNNTNGGVVWFNGGTTNGGDNNLIEECIIRDRSDSADVPVNLIFSTLSSSTSSNDNNQIISNELFNFSQRAILLFSSNWGNNWNISGNHIYQTENRATNFICISINYGSGHNIIYNYIGGSERGAKGNFMSTSGTFNGIAIAAVASANIEKNIFRKISVTNTTSISSIITNSGSGTIKNNTIGDDDYNYRIESKDGRCRD